MLRRPADIRLMRWFRLMRQGSVVVIIIGVSLLGKAENGPSADATANAHGNIECSLCHPLAASIDASVGAAVVPTKKCRSCHEPGFRSKSELSGLFHQDSNRSCDGCHFYHDPARIVAEGRTFELSQPAGSASCLACHNQSGSVVGLSEGHLRAAALYHSDHPALAGLTASQSCLLCHSENQTLQIDGVAMASVPRFDEHHMHPIGEMKPGGQWSEGGTIRRSIDPRLRLFNNRIECQTCHSLTSQTRYRLVSFDRPQDLCLGCHTLY